MINVTKRDGRIKEFDKSKIKAAVLAAFKEVDGEINDYALAKAENIANYIEEYASKESPERTLTIEEIQDLVEKGLMSSKRKDVARAYITYRYERNKMRTWNNEMMLAAKEKLMGTNIVNQNANVDEHSFGGRKGEFDSVVLKEFALANLISSKHRYNHEHNRVYIHDLDSYAIGNHNCMSMPMDKLLENGFNTRQTDIRPANSINTAFQLVAVLFQLQSLQQFGGVSATHLDWTMVPYVRKSFYKHYVDGLKYCEDFEPINEPNTAVKDLSIESPWYAKDIHEKAYRYAMDMTKKELQQAVEGMYHNLNTLQSRSGNQLPFTSINYGTCTLPEGRMVIKALLEGSIKGVGKLHKTPIFPCSIFQVGEGINKHEGDPNYDLFKLALESTARRLYPNYANIDWSGNAGYDPSDPKTYFSTMGCRTANGFDINHDQNVNGQTKDGRGNIAPATVVLPTIAMETMEDLISKHGEDTDIDDETKINEFLIRLDSAIKDAKDELLERFEWIASQDPASARFMYDNGVMLGYIPEEGIRSALRHGTLAIGQIGLAETLQILFGCDHTVKKGMDYAKRIEQLFKDRCAEYKEQYQLNFGVYYTPARLRAV